MLPRTGITQSLANNLTHVTTLTLLSLSSAASASTAAVQRCCIETAEDEARMSVASKGDQVQ